MNLAKEPANHMMQPLLYQNRVNQSQMRHANQCQYIIRESQLPTKRDKTNSEIANKCY